MKQFCAKRESFWDLNPKVESLTNTSTLLIKPQIRTKIMYMFYYSSYPTTQTDTKQVISLEWYPPSGWPSFQFSFDEITPGVSVSFHRLVTLSPRLTLSLQYQSQVLEYFYLCFKCSPMSSSDLIHLLWVACRTWKAFDSFLKLGLGYI